MNPAPPTELSRLLAEVERLDKAATAAPWVEYITDEFPPGWIGIRQGIESDTLTETHIATLGRFNDPQTKPNVAFIAFARTALTQLAEIVAQLQRERDDLGSKFESQRSNAEGLFEKVNALKSEIGPLKTDRHALMICLEHSREKETNLINELTTLRAQLSAAQQRVEELEGQAAN